MAREPNPSHQHLQKEINDMLSEDSSQEFGKLFLPRYSLVPSTIRDNKNISDGAKIFFGDLRVLSNKFDYCWCSDEELAEIEKKNIRTIQRWLEELEKEGFIRRDTKIEHYTILGKKGVFVRKKRKIFTYDPSNSNFNSDTTFLSGRSDTTFLSGRSDTTKMADTKTKPLRENSKTTTEPRQTQAAGSSSQAAAASSASRVVVSSSTQKEENTPPDPKPKPRSDGTTCPLSELTLSEAMKRKLRKEHSPEKLSDAVKKVLAWTSRKDDAKAIVHVLKVGDDWQVTKSEEEVVEENRAYLRTVEKRLNGKNKICGMNVSFGRDDITFSQGSFFKIFMTTEPNMKDRVIDYLNATRNAYRSDSKARGEHFDG